MKKLLFLSIAFFILLSCSSNEDNLDPLVGTWYFFFENGREVDDCNKKSTLIVIENGNLSSVNYGNQDNINECVIEGTLEAKWTNNGNGNYIMTCKSDNLKNTPKIIFKDNNNTFLSSSTNQNGRIETQTFKRK